MPQMPLKTHTKEQTRKTIEQLFSQATSFLPSKNKCCPWIRPGLLAYDHSTGRAFPTNPAGQWHQSGFRPDHSRGAARGLHSLPLRRNQKIPRPITQPGDFPFLSTNCICVHNPTPVVVIHAATVAGLLAFGSAYLPRLPNRPCRSVASKRLSSPITAAGPLPISTGFPIKPRKAPRICSYPKVYPGVNQNNEE
jgi:hypothetical protein